MAVGPDEVRDQAVEIASTRPDLEDCESRNQVEVGEEAGRVGGRGAKHAAAGRVEQADEPGWVACAVDPGPFRA